MKKTKQAQAKKVRIELTTEDLTAVRGGASDYLLELDGIKGETRATVRR